uniref:Peptidase S1 domain-containing protein n=1 Tax=Anopheles quadriannulatus TaxID=34691 RepID=A0A182X324_ANOQN
MYRGKQKHFDIGLLKLENNVNLQSNVLPACLWLNDEKSNAELIVARWNHREGISSLTKQTDIVVKDFESCISFFDPNILAINNISFLDHQMCIVNEMEDAMDLSGGPLYVDLVHDDHIVPFVIGIASTATRANLYEIDIFTKLFKFGNWIAETMREEGEEVSFEPLECAKRYLQYRRQINGSKLFDSSNTIDYMVSIHGNPDTNQTIKCTGALIGKDVVVTLGQCVINFMPYSSYVVLDDRSTINIKNIIIHPNYTANTLYNNIAILKLPEHLCLQSDYALVPGSCEAHPSAVVYWERYGTKYLLGLYMAGGHCGFGEQAIGLYIYEHNLWINSVINSPSSKSREYIDPFLNLSDVCSYANGRRGTCVSQTSCPNVRQRMENNLPIFYCKNRAVVCCLSDSETQLEAE